MTLLICFWLHNSNYVSSPFDSKNTLIARNYFLSISFSGENIAKGTIPSGGGIITVLASTNKFAKTSRVKTNFRGNLKPPHKFRIILGYN